MKRLFSNFALLTFAALFGAISLIGCKTDPVSLTVRDFAQVRVLNFTQSDMNSASCAVPIDVYFNRVGQTPDTLALANNVAYGQASVYANNLPADPGGTAYEITARPTHSKDKSFKTQTVTVFPGHRYSWILFSPTYDPTNYTPVFVEDADVAGDTNHTYVRFINVQNGASSTDSNLMDLRVNDPINGELAANGISYMHSSSYYALQTKQDSAYAFYVLPHGSSQIISRIGFQSFAPGSYHTVVYGGDLCRVAPRDTAGNPADSLRIRVYDDNTIGNDQTFPIPLTFRYNIINGLLPTVVPYDKIGFLVNNEAANGYPNFTFPPVPEFGAAPGQYFNTADNVLEVPYANSILTDAIDIKAFTVDASGNTGPELFDIHASRRTTSGKPSIVSDLPASIIVYDTVRNGSPQDSSQVKQVVIPLPDQAYPDSVRLVLVNAMAREHGVLTTKMTAKFSVNGVPDATLSNGTGALPGRSDVFTFAAATGSSTSCTITTEVPGGSNPPSVTFNAVAGAIYEVVLLGSKDAAHLTVIRLNPPGH